MSPHTYRKLGLCHVGVGVCAEVGGGNTMGVLETRFVNKLCIYVDIVWELGVVIKHVLYFRVNTKTTLFCLQEMPTGTLIHQGVKYELGKNGTCRRLKS